MVDAYNIAFRPALRTNHSGRTAIDMNINNWQGKDVMDAYGRTRKLPTLEDLYEAGASYGVMKLHSDRPHWSADGH